MSAETRYREALARHGIQDVQPLYRALLRHLKSADPELYERAVARYERDVARGLEEGEDDPVRVWIAYGIWLAGRAREGRLVAVDPTGLAEPVEAGDPPVGPLLLHLPDEARAPVTPLALPSDPSPPQRATLELLCE